MPASCSSRSTSVVAEPRDPLEVEAGERLPEVVALPQDRQPGEARLEPLEHELLEQAAVVVDREAPLGVVVGLVLGRRRAPEAAGNPVLSAHDPVVHGYQATGMKASYSAIGPSRASSRPATPHRGRP